MPTKLTAEQRTLRAKIAAHTRWSKEDPATNAARGQAGLLRKFFDETDSALPEPERWRRAKSARRAYMSRLALQATKARNASCVDGGTRAAS